MQQVERKNKPSTEMPAVQGLEGKRKETAPAAHWFLVQFIFGPENGNVSSHMDYTVLYTRRQIICITRLYSTCCEDWKNKTDHSNLDFCIHGHQSKHGLHVDQSLSNLSVY
jgi:hypothetical protein